MAQCRATAHLKLDRGSGGWVHVHPLFPLPLPLLPPLPVHRPGKVGDCCLTSSFLLFISFFFYLEVIFIPLFIYFFSFSYSWLISWTCDYLYLWGTMYASLYLCTYPTSSPLHFQIRGLVHRCRMWCRTVWMMPELFWNLEIHLWKYIHSNLPLL